MPRLTAFCIINVYGFVRRHRRFLRVRIAYERTVAAPSATSWSVFVQAWNTFVHYANFHLPPEPDGFMEQRASATCVLCNNFYYRSDFDPDGLGYVPGPGKPLSGVHASFRR